MNKFLLLSIPLLFFVQLSVAQNSIFTDRPNTTDAIQLLAPGMLQAELGYSRVKEGDFTSSDIPNLNLKYGISNWLEMRVQTSYGRDKMDIEGLDTLSNEVDGLKPITIAPKIKVVEQNFLRPAITFAPVFTPGSIGAEGFKNDHFNYGFRLLLEHVFNDKYSWSHGFGANWDDSRETTWAYSTAFSASLAGNLGAFAEIYGYFAHDFPSYHVFDAGFTYGVTPDLQLDLAGGLPLSDTAPDYTLTVGVSWRTSFK
ncbi:transporter [Fulvivirga sediminis]|uniref:Transporter n=1 Tax=Fulvivirga sediminis TaxID=2803949 RepID=A0A937F972_9BACT|nr:transporter [Fulvivirga sediminis]MBL3656599.1 transporter [Fulvivirga sediminis]